VEITTLTAMTYVVGTLLADQINAVLLNAADFRLRFVQSYGTLLGVSWIMSLLAQRKVRTHPVARLLLVNVVWACANVLPALLRDFMRIPYWSYYPVVALIAIPVTYPLHAWLTRGGLERVMALHGPPSQPTRAVWRILVVLVLFSMLAVLGSVVVVVQVYTGLPWGEVLRILGGIYS
jgi:hypothetical protein